MWKSHRGFVVDWTIRNVDDGCNSCASTSCMFYCSCEVGFKVRPDDLFAGRPAPMHGRVTTASRRCQRPVPGVDALVTSLTIFPHQSVNGVRPDVQELLHSFLLGRSTRVVVKPWHQQADRWLFSRLLHSCATIMLIWATRQLWRRPFCFGTVVYFSFFSA